MIQNLAMLCAMGDLNLPISSGARNRAHLDLVFFLRGRQMENITRGGGEFLINEEH